MMFFLYIEIITEFLKTDLVYLSGVYFKFNFYN